MKRKSVDEETIEQCNRWLRAMECLTTEEFRKSDVGKLEMTRLHVCKKVGVMPVDILYWGESRLRLPTGEVRITPPYTQALFGDLKMLPIEIKYQDDEVVSVEISEEDIEEVFPSRVEHLNNKQENKISEDIDEITSNAKFSSNLALISLVTSIILLITNIIIALS